MSLWGATVITKLCSAIPEVGDPVVKWLWGGDSVDKATLTRFFSLHYLLPFILIVLAGIHLYALHKEGSTNPLECEVVDRVPFYPYYYLKDMLALAIFIICMLTFVYYFPNILGHPVNFTKADALVTPKHIVPEWYFLPFYAILRSIPSKSFGVFLMILSIIVFAFLPFIDRTDYEGPRVNFFYRIFF